MAERKWGVIASGATFEALATTIVFFEDPKAALFGRRGRDGGQDARSGDGTRVYQAKHHADGSAAKAIADARTEAAKIRAYRHPGHARYDQWQGVTHWRLVTNATFNPTDQQTWDTEVVPLFTGQGLTPDYWERAHLDALLDKHPEIHRSFFENETRAALSLPEVRERLNAEEPFLQRASNHLFGRAAEVAQVQGFLSADALFLVLHGAGGIGKTRLLLEAGEEIAANGAWQVLWANVASMSASATWFESVVPERPTLLLVDEPDEEDLLRVLAEQLGGRVGRATQWKVAVAVRSPKDPVLRFLFAPRMQARVRDLALGALPADAAEAMCSDLLGSGPLASDAPEATQTAARELARRFSRHPVWLTLAVHLLEKHGDLTRVPQDAAGLADVYLDEIVNLQDDAPAELVLLLLRWLSLVGTVNREDEATIKLLTEGSSMGDEVATRRALARLVQRRALVQRGARSRLVELKPDVLRDHVLLRWLAVDVGYGDSPMQPSEDARALAASVQDAVLQGNIASLGRAVLQSLARTELILRLSDRTVPLLDGFFAGLRDALGRTPASVRLLIAEVLLEVAFFRPAAATALARAMRLDPVAEETISGLFHTRQLGQDDIVLALAWPVFHAAMGAQTPADREAVLEELCALADAETAIATRRARGLPNDGKRAAHLLARSLEGGPQFWSDYEDAARSVANRLLETASHEAATPGMAAVLKALLVPATALERRQSWADEQAFHMQTWFVVPDHPAWVTRELIVSRVKALLADSGVPRATRLALWPVLIESHRSAIQCRGHGPEEVRVQVRSLLAEDLAWAQSVLAARTGDVEELAAARDLWDWHYQFDSDAELKAAGSALEALYNSNDLASEFEPLLSRKEWQDREPRLTQKAEELAREGTPAAIDAFIDRAVRFLGSERELYLLNNVAWHLGAHAPNTEAVAQFVRGAIGEPGISARTDFAACAAASWVATLRHGTVPGEAHGLIADLLAACSNDAARLLLLERLYGRSPPRSDAGQMTPEEHRFLRSLAPLFMNNGKGPALVQAIGPTLAYDWPGLRELLEQTLDGMPQEQVGAAVRALVDVVYWAVCHAGATQPGLGPWLLEQLLRVTDMDTLGDQVDWHVQELLKRVGRPSVEWLAMALARRQAMESSDTTHAIRAISLHLQLSRFVTPVAEEDRAEQGKVAGVDLLVGFAADAGTVGYHLPEILRDIDPAGVLVPNAVARRMSDATNVQDVWRLARIAGGYAVGGQPWRVIARSAMARAAGLAEDERRSLFSALRRHGPRSWSGRVGEVPQVFLGAAQVARKLLESEEDPVLRPFWEWNVAVADAELRQAEERAKEERGE